MAIETECPKCEMCYAAPDDWAGKTVKCPECGEGIVVPFILEVVEADDLGLVVLEPDKSKTARPKTDGARPPSPSAQKPSAKGNTPSPRKRQTPKPAPLDPRQYDPLSELLNDDRGARPAAARPAGGPLTPAGAGGVASGRTLAPSKRQRAAPSGGNPALGFLRRHRLASILAVVAVLVVVVVAGVALVGRTKYASKDSGLPPGEPVALDKIAVPEMPERPASRTLEPGVEFAEVRLDVPQDQPGQESTLCVYTPSGWHEPKSLACILIAPAGSNLLSGMKLGDGDRKEHIPYVKAGMAVVAYEIDGPYSCDPDKVSTAEAREALRKFTAAGGGVVNARNALEFVLARMPEVDPYRIYAAGHSSAGTLALLFAQEEKRLRGCIAYAPVINLYKRFRASSVELERELPGAGQAILEFSPDAGKYPSRCPLFLFHAEDDSNVPVSDSEDFAERLKRSAKDVTLVTVPRGGHFDPMINEGIPRAIAWLASKKPAAPVAVDWDARPDPLPAASAALEAIALKTTEREVYQVRFPGPQAARAVVLNRPTDRQANYYFIDTYDLARRRYLGRFKVPRTAQLTDVSPDGHRALTVTESLVHVWSLDEGRPLADWEITGDGETRGGPARFVGESHVLTHDGRIGIGRRPPDRMIVWSLPECKPAYTVKGVCDVALSSGRKYAVAFLKDGGATAATVYEAATGKPRGSLPSPPGAHGRFDPRSWAFTDDGLLLAACGAPMAVWDFSDGKLLVETPASLNSGDLRFLGKDYLIQGGDLFDRGRHRRIWRYEHSMSPSTWTNVFGGPDGRVWTLLSRSYRDPVYLVPLDLPDRETKAAIASDSLGDGRRPRTSQISFDTVFGARQPPAPLPESVAPGHGQGAEALVSAGSHPGRPFVRPVVPPVGPTVGPRSPPDHRPPEKKPAIDTPVKKPAVEKPAADDVVTQSREYARRFACETIAADDAAVAGMVQWLPAAKQPVLGVRWGVGLFDADAERQPPAGDVTSLGRLTAAVSLAVTATLDKGAIDGGFGIWPDEGDRQLRRTALLGSGRQSELIEAARRRGLDLLMIFTLSQRTVNLSKKQYTTLRVRILDVPTSRQLWTSEAGNLEQAPLGLLRETIKEIDSEFRLTPMPAIKPEHAAGRVARLSTTSPKADPGQLLRVLLELRYYQARGLVKPESLVPVYDKIVGAGRGATMATGTTAARRTLLAEWLEGR